MDDEDGQEDAEAPVDDAVEHSENGRYARFSQVLGRGAFKTGAVIFVLPLFSVRPSDGLPLRAVPAKSTMPAAVPAETVRRVPLLLPPFTGSKAAPASAVRSASEQNRLSPRH